MNAITFRSFVFLYANGGFQRPGEAGIVVVR
jgi:hypothetical protein